MIDFNNKEALWCKTPENLICRFSYFWSYERFSRNNEPLWKPYSRGSVHKVQRQPSPEEIRNHFFCLYLFDYSLYAVNSDLSVFWFLGYGVHRN